MTPPPETLEEARKRADRAELAAAVETGNLPVAFDFVLANLYETQLEIKEVGKHLTRIYEQLGELDGLPTRLEHSIALQEVMAARVARLDREGEITREEVRKVRRTAGEIRRAADDSQQRAILASKEAAEAIIAHAAEAAARSAERDVRASEHELVVEHRRGRLSVWWRANRWPAFLAFLVALVSTTGGAIVTYLLTHR